MTCLNGKKGVELQLKAEKKTHTIAKPYPSFIPTIVYDEVNEREKKNLLRITEVDFFNPIEFNKLIEISPSIITNCVLFYCRHIID